MTVADPFPTKGISTMRNRSRKGLFTLAASVAVSTVLGLAGATAASAGTHVKPHATTVCNNVPNFFQCTNISSLLLNQNNDPEFVQNATSLGSVGGTDQGRKINLRQASDTRVNEDFIIRYVGLTGQLCGVGGVNGLDPTSYACLNYPDDYPVFQGQFAPDSNESGFCVGALSATLGFKIRLERCGSPKSFWVGDIKATVTKTDPSGKHKLYYIPLEFAADTSASNPLVLTLNPNSTKPADGLSLQQENFSGGFVTDRQLWALTGPVGYNFSLEGGGGQADS
jgi:hypothetical protein